MKYLVTGATGGFGGAALEKLKTLVAVSDIHVLARSEEKAAPLAEAGYTVHIGDYLNKESLKSALTGIDRLLFVSSAPGTRQEEHQNVLDAAKEAGVSFITYTSFPHADQSSAELSADHRYTEDAIKATGIPSTILRNNWYLENELPLVGAALNSGKLLYTAEDGKAGWALRREYAEAAAIVLAGKKEFPEILELSGQPVNYETLTTALSEAIGKEITAKSVNDEDFIKNLTDNQLPEPVAQFFLTIQHDIKNGVLDVQSDDLETVLGKPLTPLVDAFKELL
ncbi:SDR family oxidoreductase [Aerococcaceae bacterium 50-4]